MKGRARSSLQWLGLKMQAIPRVSLGLLVIKTAVQAIRNGLPAVEVVATVHQTETRVPVMEEVNDGRGLAPTHGSVSIATRSVTFRGSAQTRKTVTGLREEMAMIDLGQAAASSVVKKVILPGSAQTSRQVETAVTEIITDGTTATDSLTVIVIVQTLATIAVQETFSTKTIAIIGTEIKAEIVIVATVAAVVIANTEEIEIVIEAIETNLDLTVAGIATVDVTTTVMAQIKSREEEEATAVGSRMERTDRGRVAASSVARKVTLRGSVRMPMPETTVAGVTTAGKEELVATEEVAAIEIGMIKQVVTEVAVAAAGAAVRKVAEMTRPGLEVVMEEMEIRDKAALELELAETGKMPLQRRKMITRVNPQVPGECLSSIIETREVRLCECDIIS